MAMHIRGLSDYGLDWKDLRSLGDHLAEVTAQLKGPDLEPLCSMVPPDRKRHVDQWYRDRMEAVRRAWPNDDVRVRGSIDEPLVFDSTVNVSQFDSLRRLSDLESIFVNRIHGLRRKPNTRLSWFAVRARVAIQVEGMTRGLQTVEDRIMIVKARSHDDAISRLESEFREYAQPYLNSDCEFVRWKLEEFIETYAVDQEIDPKGTEVFSTLRQRRMRPEYEWHPRLETPDA